MSPGLSPCNGQWWLGLSLRHSHAGHPHEPQILISPSWYQGKLKKLRYVGSCEMSESGCTAGLRAGSRAVRLASPKIHLSNLVERTTSLAGVNTYCSEGSCKVLPIHRTHLPGRDTPSHVVLSFLIHFPDVELQLWVRESERGRTEQMGL